MTRIAAAQVASIRRTVARWEEGSSVPDEQYQMLLAPTYARTVLGSVSLGPGSDFRELLEALSMLGVEQSRLDELCAVTMAAVTDQGTSLLTFLCVPQRAELAATLADPNALDIPVVDGLGAAADAVNEQIGGVPFVRLRLAATAIVDACRFLLAGERPSPVRDRLEAVAARTFALAGRLAFETHDDDAALALYDDAVLAAGAGDPSRRALIRTSQTMVTYYATGSVDRARRLADAAVRDARRGDSILMRARAHALRAEMAARSEPVRHRQAQAALHMARHDLDGDTVGDPMADVFSHGRLRGFEGVCGIFLGEAEAAGQQLAASAATLTQSRKSVQRAIVLTDRALARLYADDVGGPVAAVEQLHECVDLTARVRGQVPAQRLRHVRLELRPWRHEGFVSDLDDHIHGTMIGM